MKSIQLKKYPDYYNSNKENFHPNIQLLSTQQQIRVQQHSSKHPKVSIFKPVLIQQFQPHRQKDWRKRILTLSERQKNLNNRLMRMMMGGRNSPLKLQKIHVSTQAASHQKYSQKQLGNTLRRYLYERSNQNTASMIQGFNICNNTQLNINSNMLQIVEGIHSMSQQITGVQIPVLDNSNVEEILGCVFDALKQYKQNFRFKELQMKEIGCQTAVQQSINLTI